MRKQNIGVIKGNDCDNFIFNCPLCNLETTTNVYSFSFNYGCNGCKNKTEKKMFFL